MSSVERVQKIVFPHAICFSQNERNSRRSCRCVTRIAGSYHRRPPRDATASAKAVSSPELDSGNRAAPTASRR